MHTADPLVPEPSPFVVAIVIQKLKKYTEQIPAEVIQPGGNTRTLHSEI
jgi:hypothetical protein